MNSEICIYTPEKTNASSLLRSLFSFWGNVITHRELLWQLLKRDLLSQYKKTFFGILWLFVAPLITIVSWVLLNRAGILRPGNVGVPYGVYVLMGTTMWNLFVGVYTASSGTLTAGQGIVHQVRYPHEVLLVKQLAQHFIGFILSFVFALCISIAYGIKLQGICLALPLVAAPIYFLAVGLGLVSSLINVVIADITNTVNYVLGFLIYLAPIIYSKDVESSTLRMIFKWNPLAYLVCAARDMVLYGKITEPHGFFWSALFSFFVFILSWQLFRLGEARLIEKMV